MTSWDPPDRPSMEMQAPRRPHEGVGEDGRGRGRAVPAVQLQLRRLRGRCRRPHPRDAVQDVWRDIAVFPFCNTCARRMVWRDIMGADAPAADPNIAADEQGLGWEAFVFH